MIRARQTEADARVKVVFFVWSSKTKNREKESIMGEQIAPEVT